MNAIEMQRTDFKVGELINPNNGHVLTQAEVDAYNHYTEDLNRERHVERREFLMDQRHRFFVACAPLMSIVLQHYAVDGGYKVLVDFHDGKEPEFQGYWKQGRETLDAVVFRLTKRPLAAFHRIKRI